MFFHHGVTPSCNEATCVPSISRENSCLCGGLSRRAIAKGKVVSTSRHVGHAVRRTTTVLRAAIGNLIAFRDPGEVHRRKHNGCQLYLSLWSHVAQIQPARSRPGTPKGDGFYGSRHESAGMGDAGEKWAFRKSLFSGNSRHRTTKLKYESRSRY